jgi:hypothetical protein
VLVVQIIDPIAGFIVVLDISSRVAHRLKLPRIEQRGHPGFAGFIGSIVPTIEVLDRKVIQGIEFTGTRITSIPEGQASSATVYEQWLSTDFGLAGLLTLTSPNEQRTVKIHSVEQGEPDPDLFVIPSGYAIRELVP